MRIDKYVVTDSNGLLRFGPKGFEACRNHINEAVRLGAEPGTMRVEHWDEWTEREGVAV